MAEQRRNKFPEIWIKYAFIFFIFGFSLLILGPYFQTDPIQKAISLAAGIIITVISVFFGIVAFMFGLLVWYDRYVIAKNVIEILGSTNIETSPIQSNRPAYLLANSFDREVLVTISQVGGDLPNTMLILEDEALLRMRNDLVTSIVKLITLGLLSIPSKFPYYRVFLTTRGLDAMNTPAALFVSNIPDGIWQYMLQMKLKLSDGEWSGAAISMANSVQSMLIHRIEEVKTEENEVWEDTIQSLNEKWKGIVEKPLIKWQIGDLLHILRQVGKIKQTSFEDHLISELISMRNKVHPPDEGIRPYPFSPRDASLMDLYMDILIQMWYGPQ